MSIRIDIVNEALVLLGAQTITSIEDDSRQAQVMKNLYYISRDATLEAHEWSFAIRQWTPAEDADTPPNPWSHSYQLPSDIIRLLRVDRGYYASGVQRNEIDHELQGRAILTNEPIGFCTGIRRVEDEGIYSTLFAEAFAAKLAMKACMALTQSKALQQNVAGMFALAIKQAKSRDGQQGTTRRLRSRWMERARRGIYGVDRG